MEKTIIKNNIIREIIIPIICLLLAITMCLGSFALLNILSSMKLVCCRIILAIFGI